MKISDFHAKLLLQRIPDTNQILKWIIILMLTRQDIAKPALEGHVVCAYLYDDRGGPSLPERAFIGPGRPLYDLNKQIDTKNITNEAVSAGQSHSAANGQTV